MPTTTWRTDLRAALVGIMNDQIAATPTLLRKVYPARPESFKELPCAYIQLPERLTHDSQTRTRFAAPDIFIVDAYRDNVQGTAQFDQLIDLLVERFDLSANVQRIAGSIIELVSITETDIQMVGPEKTVTYPGIVLGLGEGKTFIMEGRQ